MIRALRQVLRFCDKIYLKYFIISVYSVCSVPDGHTKVTVSIKDAQRKWEERPSLGAKVNFGGQQVALALIATRPVLSLSNALCVNCISKQTIIACEVNTAVR